MPNVWTALVTKDDVDAAENLIAAAIGADVDPAVFTEELRLYVAQIFPASFGFPDDVGEEVAQRLLHAIAALAGVSRGIAANLAAYVAEGTGQDPDDDTVTRPLELGFVGGGAKALRATIAHEPDAA